MKRPPGLWIFLAAGFLWLSSQDVDCIRATSLIFGKQSTTTTTEAPSAASDETDEETASNSVQSNSTTNSTEPVLSGNPQIDYIYDPNLPQELNGYNLSDYPFYERVPEEIDFKCDGLHDGFYASVPHKCQVYHHCLFGTRYDFLCANFTAFDQKTFICHFVSEVDCQNSKKFWHRNDALYEAQSTTTTTGIPLRAAIYTTASPLGDPATPLSPLPAAPRRPAGGRRPYRPNRRRRPQFDYYEDEYYDDEYYDDRPRSNRGRKRPRPRPRPVYDDDYEEYEDERYESRRGSSRRRPYRDRRKNKDRRKQEYDDEDVVEDDDFVAGHKRQKNEERRSKRPLDDYDEPERDRKPSGDRKSSRKGSRRPASAEYEDDVSAEYDDRPRKRNKDTNADGRPIIKSSTGTIYDRPRVAPRINLPVPKNAADKFSYKSLGGGPTPSTTTTTTVPPEITDEDEELEYDEPTPKRLKNRDRRPSSDSKREKEDTKPQPSSSRPRNRKPEPPRSRYRPSLKRKPSSEEYYDDSEEEYQDEPKKSARKASTTSTTTTTTTTTTEPPRKDPIMRIVKRPFLPSRGGNPYSPRGLQPVGLKASDQEEEDYSDEKRGEEEEEAPPPRKPFKPSPVAAKVPRKPEELIDLEPSRPQTYIAPRTTQRPRVKSPDLLDLNEYDVTLNDALNPTLPNLPIRAFPVGFTTGGDYNYANYQRPRYVETGSHNRGGLARPAQTQAILSGY